LIAPTSLHRNVAEEVVHAIKWAITRRYMTLETVAAICDTAPMDPATIAVL